MSDETLRLLERGISVGEPPEHYIAGLIREGRSENAIRIAQARLLGILYYDFEYVVEDLNVKFMVYERKWEKSSVVFSMGNRDPDMERPPYGRKGDNPENDRLWRLYNKEEMRIMREQAFRGLALLGITLPGKTDAKKLPFSSKAGCSLCSCSPGFKPRAIHLKMAWKQEEGYRVVPLSSERRIDIYVTRIPSPEEQAELDEEFAEFKGAVV